MATAHFVHFNLGLTTLELKTLPQEFVHSLRTLIFQVNEPENRKDWNGLVALTKAWLRDNVKLEDKKEIPIHYINNILKSILCRPSNHPVLFGIKENNEEIVLSIMTQEERLTRVPIKAKEFCTISRERFNPYFPENIHKKKEQTIKQVKSGAEREFLQSRLKEFSIVLCGAARVGKSTLINAMSGRKVAPTSARLDSCTKKLCKFPFQVEYENEEHRCEISTISFWDTPGIENWTEADVHAFINEIIVATLPICLIYCASPGSHANTNIIEWFAETCAHNNVFVALVCTNMYAGSNQQREAVLADFKKILFGIARNNNPQKEGDIFLWPKIGLVAAVNSDAIEIGKHTYPAEGVNELCMAIMRQLDDSNKLLGWCLSLLENRSFWEKFSHGLKDLLSPVAYLFKMMFS